MTKEAEGLRKIYKHLIDKRREITKNTSFKVEDVLGDVIRKDTFSQEQMNRLNTF